MNNTKTSIIWNVTSLCSWNCKICCVNAKYVGGLKQVNTEKDSEFSYKEELSFEDKKKIIDQLEPGKFKVDFSGGELLIDPLNVDLVVYASERLGADNVGVSTSGTFLTDEVIHKLKGKVRDVEITLDYVPFRGYKLRPVGYHEFASYAIKELKRNDFEVGVQTVLTKCNMEREMLSDLHKWIVENRVDSWSLLRFFPAGRGKYFSEYTPSQEEYKDVVDYIKTISDGGKVDVQFQYLLPNHAKYTHDCRAVKKSIGILPNGTVVSCFWALDEKMKPVRDMFLLGNLPEENIQDVLSNDKACYWKNSEHKCMIFCDGQSVFEQGENSEKTVVSSF